MTGVGDAHASAMGFTVAGLQITFMVGRGNAREANPPACGFGSEVLWFRRRSFNAHLCSDNADETQWFKRMDSAESCPQTNKGRLGWQPDIRAYSKTFMDNNYSIWNGISVSCTVLSGPAKGCAGPHYKYIHKLSVFNTRRHIYC